jgi:hypothetical protein
MSWRGCPPRRSSRVPRDHYPAGTVPAPTECGAFARERRAVPEARRDSLHDSRILPASRFASQGHGKIVEARATTWPRPPVARGVRRTRRLLAVQRLGGVGGPFPRWQIVSHDRRLDEKRSRTPSIVSRTPPKWRVLLIAQASRSRCARTRKRPRSPRAQLPHRGRPRSRFRLGNTSAARIREAKDLRPPARCAGRTGPAAPLPGSFGLRTPH